MWLLWSLQCPARRLEVKVRELSRRVASGIGHDAIPIAVQVHAEMSGKPLGYLKYVPPETRIRRG